MSEQDNLDIEELRKAATEKRERAVRKADEEYQLDIDAIERLSRLESLHRAGQALSEMEGQKQ